MIYYYHSRAIQNLHYYLFLREGLFLIMMVMMMMVVIINPLCKVSIIICS